MLVSVDEIWIFFRIVSGEVGFLWYLFKLKFMIWFRFYRNWNSKSLNFVDFMIFIFARSDRSVS